MMKQRPPSTSAIKTCALPARPEALLKRRGSVLLAGMLLLLLSISAQAQKKTVTGKIIDYGSNEPVPGVTVKVKNTSSGTMSDAQGMFSLSVPEGALLDITSIGYQSAEVQAVFGKSMLIKVTSQNKALTE